MAGEMQHRRSQSDAAGLLLDGHMDTAPAPGHVRSVSLGSSASQFLSSLKLQDPAAFQQGAAASADVQLALPDQHTPHTAGGGADGLGAGQSARSKRAHRGNNGRTSKGAMQLDTALAEQQPHGFTPLPAVVENSAMDSERDWDSDSDGQGFGPNRRSSRAGGRRGGCNGRSESELMLLDPKRVKRILANRESAARSKERRLNYTMELEGKLQALSVESDKLHTQLHSISKQEGKLRNSKANLEQQVHGVQQQLAQVVSDNHTLLCTLYQLQAALGLPQALPDGIMTLAAMQEPAPDAGHYQQAWQPDQQQPQQKQRGSKQPTSPKPRKPRRQGKQQAASKQQSPSQYAWSGGSYAGGVEPDLSDPAAAAAAPVAELPVRPKSLNNLAAAAAAAAAAVGPGPGHVLAAGLTGSGGSVPHSLGVEPPAAGQPPRLHVSPRQHQWHTGLGGGSSSSTPAATPQPGAAGQPLPAAAAFAPPAAAAAAVGGSGAGGTAAAAGMLLLGQQLPAPGADAVMAADEDEVAMLGAFLAEDDDPVVAEAPVGTASAGTGAAAAAAAAAGLIQQGQHGSFGPAVGGVGGASAAAAAASAGGISCAVPPAQTVTTSLWPHSSAGGSSKPTPPSAAAAAVGAAGMHPAAAAGAGLFSRRDSPALSDPVAGEFWHPAHAEELSSGSVGGSLTHSHTPNLTPSGRLGGEGVNGVGPAYAAGGWQQQQQQHYPGGRADVVSPRGAAGMAGGVPGAHCPQQVSPITPDSGARALHAATGSGVAALTGSSQHAGATHVAAHPHLQHQQQAHQGQQQHQVQFVMGANPAAAGRAGRHVRSASTGCVSGLGLGWQGYDQSNLLTTGAPYLQQQQQHLAHQQQQQQQQRQGAHMQAGGLHVQHTAFTPDGSVVGGYSTTHTASVADFSQAAGAAPGQVTMGQIGGQVVGQVPDPGQVSYQRQHRRSHSHAAAFMGQAGAGLAGQYEFAASTWQYTMPQ